MEAPRLSCDEGNSNPPTLSSGVGFSHFNPHIGAEVCSVVDKPQQLIDDDVLVGRFSIMNVTSDGINDNSSSSLHLLKRGPDALTIEGSPMNSNRTFKRVDLNPTPSRAITAYDSRIIRSTTIDDVTDKIYVSSNASRTGPELLVICSSSDEHDNGDHQENALRTSLLSGVDGCLRRPELRDSVVFRDADLLSPPPLADLLRYNTGVALTC